MTSGLSSDVPPVGGCLPSTLHRDFLTCSVCLGPYTDPRLLPCLHSFCCTCLQQVMDDACTMGVTAFPCPVCRLMTSIPDEGGVSTFKLNFFLANLQETVAAIAEESGHARLCQVCTDNSQVEFYCIDCRDFLCKSCAHAHQRVKLTRKHKLVMQEQVTSGKIEEEIRERQKLICKEHDEPMKLFCDDCQGAICCNCKLTSHSAHRAIAVKDQIKEDKTLLKNKLDTLSTRLVTMQMYFNNLVDYEKDIDKSSLTISKNISEREKELNEVIFKHSRELSKKIAQITLDEKKEILSYRDLLTNHLQSMKEAKDFTLQLLKFGSDAEIVALCPDLKSKLDQIQSIPCVDLIHKQRLQLLFEASDLEDNRLISKMGGEVETRNLGSVFTASVTKGELQHEFQCHSATDENTCYIRSMAVTHDNKLVVLDQNNNKVKMFSMQGRLVGEFTFMEKMKNPVGVSVLQDGKIAILDEIRGIRVFSQSGRYVRSLNTQTKAPFGMCVLGTDQLLVSDRKLRCVNVSKSDGTFVKHLPEGHDERPILSKPCSVAVIPPNRVVVADVQHHCVKVLDASDGHLLCGYGSRGDSNSCHLNLPLCVCVDEQEHIIIVDYHNDRLHLLNREARFITHVIDKSHNLHHPTAAVVSNEGLLLVSTEAGDVHVFKYLV